MVGENSTHIDECLAGDRHGLGVVDASAGDDVARSGAGREGALVIAGIDITRDALRANGAVDGVKEEASAGCCEVERRAKAGHEEIGVH